MISINKSKEDKKYIIDISKNIYIKLKNMNIDVIISEKYLNNEVINIINDPCNDCRGEETVKKQGYSYYFKYNEDGNLKEITYYIDDEEIIKNTWKNLVKDIITEIEDNFGYDSLDRNTEESIDTYIVWFDDTLESIAEKFDVSKEELKILNNLENDNLIVGTTLIIPESKNIIYKVKEGDSLYRIAKKFNISVDELKRINNLSSNMLKIGQKLIVGKKNNDTYQEYKVKENDNIYSIANKFDLTIEEIKKLNNKKSNELILNEILKIPK